MLLAQVPGFVARIDRTGTLTDEVVQTLRERLFLGGTERAPRIAGYQGRGSLLAWLRVTAIHAAFHLAREQKAHAEVELDETAMINDQADPALELITQRHREEFQDAVRAALSALPARERNLLRLHLVAGVSTHKLAAMYHVGQSTIVRSLTAARQQVREVTLTRLAERLGMTGVELESLAGLLLSRLDVSLTGCLRKQ